MSRPAEISCPARHWALGWLAAVLLVGLSETSALQIFVETLAGKTLSRDVEPTLHGVERTPSAPFTLAAVAGGLGGGVAVAGPYALQDTTGQTGVGVAGSADYGLEEGFWPAVHDALQTGVPLATPMTNGPAAFPVAVLLARCVDPEGDPLTLVALDPVSAQGGTLTRSNGWVFYFPPPGFSSTDTFRYVVQSAVGDQSPATVVISKVNPPPVLEPIPELAGYVQMHVTLTNLATDPDQPLMFGLGADTPPDVFLDPTSGLLIWVPTRAHARTTNHFTVWVQDSGLPPAFATNTITVVVGDYLALGLGQAVVRAGDADQVPVTLDTSSGLTRVSALAHLPDARLTVLTLTGWAPEVGQAAVQPAADNEWRLQFVARAGQCFQGVQTLGQLTFAAVPNLPSTFVRLQISDLANLQTNGLPVAHTLGENGRVTVVGRGSLLEALPPKLGRPNLALYGPSSTTYRIEAATDVLATGGWQPVWEGTMPADGLLLFPDLSATSIERVLLFRVRELSAP